MREMRAPVRALCSKLIDYAGLFPPTGLDLPAVIDNYERYRSSADGWILNRLVLPDSAIGSTPICPGWRVSLLIGDREPAGPLAPEIETFESKARGRFSRPTYVEGGDGDLLKVRTGGLTPETIPGSEEIADFLCGAAFAKDPFKATAGLHHAIRADRPLTYAPDSPRAVMHGFVNVFAAAAFAWHGADRSQVLATLNETDPRAFDMSDNSLTWNGRSLSTAQIADARANFAHSFGSCSFEEPVADLRDLGWLP
jgi:hypothetical protein